MVTEGLQLDIPRQTQLWESVVSCLRVAIIKRDLEPGARLLEEELAARLGVSRGPVREALRWLEQEGLVESRGRRGTFVVGLSERDVRELYDMRALLETRAAQRAAERACTEDLQDLQDLVDTMADVTRRGRYDLLIEPDMEFHRKIVLLADHKRLLACWELSVELVRACLSITEVIRHALPRAALNHQPIVDALRTRDRDAVAEAVRGHMERGEQVMLAVVRGELELDPVQVPQVSS